MYGLIPDRNRPCETMWRKMAWE